MTAFQPSPNVLSFLPQVAKGCRILLLGSAPSVRSLAMQQSYAHPQNLFWPLMGEMFDASPELPYAERILRLQTQGLGIWDVLKHCERPGSLDSHIVAGSEVPNDIPGLLKDYPTIRVLAFNGSKAYQVFRRRILPLMDAEKCSQIECLPLPSTSPANASMSAAVKKVHWKNLLLK